jgi:hypothetical protein
MIRDGKPPPSAVLTQEINRVDSGRRSAFTALLYSTTAIAPGTMMKSIRSFILALFATMIIFGCGEKDEEKASQNRPAIPGY